MTSTDHDLLQTRLCEDSGTALTPSVSVKQEVVNETMESELEEEDDLPDDEEDPHRLRIKEPTPDDSVFDGGGGAQDEADQRPDTPPPTSTTTTTTATAVVVIKSEAIPQPDPPATHVITPVPTESSKSTIRPWSNGVHPVRPDVIFSHRRASESPPQDPPVPVVTKATANPPPTTTTVSRVPSVILGQSGGVKTMVWTGHWADGQQQQPSTPSRPRSLPTGSAPESPVRSKPVHSRLLDGADPTIRLSVDGLLSLAQSSERTSSSSLSSSPSSSSRSSPPHGSPSSSTASPERPSVVSIQRSPPAGSHHHHQHFATPLRVQTPTSSSPSSSQGSSSPPALGLLTVARHRHPSGTNGYAFPTDGPHHQSNSSGTGHHHGLPPSISRPGPALLSSRPGGTLSSSGGVITTTSSVAPSAQQAAPLSMERLWETAAAKQRNGVVAADPQALDYSVCSGRTVIVSSNSNGDVSSALNGHHNGRAPSANGHSNGIHPAESRMEVDEEDDTPMICMICEDKATGLHYGIITCEG